MLRRSAVRIAGRAFPLSLGAAPCTQKAQGKLQDQEHQIADGESGKPIETKKSLVGKVIEEKTGMDFDRFTRSILLAQGSFDTFLQAEDEQKSKLLEQISGSEIYSEISRRVHERQRDEREKLQLLQAETVSIAVLEPAREKAIQQELEAKQQEENALTEKSSATAKAITWLRNIEDLKKEILSLTDEAVKLKTDIEAFAPQRIRLEQAIEAASLDGTYATLTALRKQQADDQLSLKKDAAALLELESSASKHAEALEAAEQLALESKEHLQTAAPLLRKIRFLDQKIAEQAKAVSDNATHCGEETAKIEMDRRLREKEREKLSEARKSRASAERYLEEHVQDEWLIAGLGAVQEQFANLLAKEREIASKESVLENAETDREAAAKTLAIGATYRLACEQKLESATKKLRQGKERLRELLGEKLLREYRTEKETLLREMAYIGKIEALEAHRAQLEDGKPCPLCGASEHPFAAGNVPIGDEIERRIASLGKRIDAAEAQDRIIEGLEEAQSAARKNLDDSERRETTAANDKNAAEKTLADLQNERTKLRGDFKALKLTVSQKLEPLGITEIPESGLASLLDTLQARLRRWQEKIRQKSEIEKQITAIESVMTRLDAMIETRDKSLTEKKENLQRLKKEQADALDERKALYGDKNPDDEESRLNEAISEAEEAEKNVRQRNSEVQRQLTAAKAHVDSLKKRLEQRTPDLKKAQTAFSSALKIAGFAAENHFLEAKMSNEERESLSSRAQELDTAQAELQAREKDRRKRLNTEIAREMSDKTLAALEAQCEKEKQTLKELRDSVAALAHKLRENTAAKARMKEKRSAIEAQQNECRRWENLHALIGAADGKKYRNFAQGLTFERMIGHANRQLRKMSDRYLLIRDQAKPLALNVIDNYQAGEIRATKNLSGGESFIVSLSLALGLSHMASKNVRVDSLFLDEGFGTLDEEALDTALETLASLQQEGKLIGVISHVAALKERIATQIQITPRGGGRSRISGPGCG